MVWSAGSGYFLINALVVAVIAAALVFGYMEFQVRMLRTTTTQLPGGLLFSSKFLTMGTRNASQEVVVNAPLGRHSPSPMLDVAQQPRQALAVLLPAVGLRCEVLWGETTALRTSDRCTVRLSSPHAETLEALGMPAAPCASVLVEGVPFPVAQALERFATRMGLWVERVERRIHLQREKELAIATEAAKLAAIQKAANKNSASNAPVGEEERKARIDQQIEVLRKAAGFKGSNTEYSADPSGQIKWLIDLEPGGRAILQTGKQSFHGSLKGAKVTTLTGELELTVRNALWTEDDPSVSVFKILDGLKPEMRLAWKERLDILIRGLR
jgi:hypothetical protein